MLIAGFPRAICFASLCCAAIPEVGGAQSVVARHSVVAEVVPVGGIRDGSWGVVRAVDGGIQVRWSGEIRGNTAAEVQVMSPRELDRTAYARTDGGLWVPLHAGTWSTVTVTPAGRRVVTMEVLIIAPGVASPVLPTVRVIGGGALPR